MYAPATQVELCRVLRDGLFDLEVRPPPCRAVQCLHTANNSERLITCWIMS